MKTILSLFLLSSIFIGGNCSRSSGSGDDPPDPPPPEAVYDETGCLYKSINGLVMAGYQGWFAAQGDGADRGWYHFQNGSCGGFLPGCSSIDFWPDMSEYTKTYASPFQFSNGTNAPLYSPFNEESIDLHFKWMKDYGIRSEERRVGKECRYRWSQ